MGRGTPGPLDPIPGNTVIDIRNWGSISTEESTTDAIDAALNAAQGEGGGIVQLPPEAITTSGGHVIPLGVRVRGFGEVTEITHTGDNACFSSHPGDITDRSGLSGVRITGNAGTSAIGLSHGDQWGFVASDVLIEGYTAGIGWQWRNTTHWTEGTESYGVRIRNCAVCLEMSRSVTSPYDSFGFTNVRSLSINVPANGIGIRVGNETGALTSLLYNSRLEATFWVDDDGVGLRTTTNGNITASLFITGEPEGGATNTTLIDNDGSILYVGNVFTYAGAFTNTFGGANLPTRSILIDPSSSDTSVLPVVGVGEVPGTQSHAGMGAIIGANRENLIAWGYDFGDNPVFQVAARPFAANTAEAWDASAQIAFEVLADGGISVNGNYVQMGNGCFWYSGSGTPEGAVTGPVGSLFTRTDGGATTTLYVKTSGVGNTGWTAK